MRKGDKLKNMVKANKCFQERANKEGQTLQEEEIEYTPIPDFHPMLSKLLSNEKIR